MYSIPTGPQSKSTPHESSCCAEQNNSVILTSCGLNGSYSALRVHDVSHALTHRAWAGGRPQVSSLEVWAELTDAGST